ncbi:MAG: hypothetical protein NTW27_09370 [Deltaproteobacteria bacterium]|nr:hypothetical protein [Deltaproteobacteria bacterium]
MGAWLLLKRGRGSRKDKKGQATNWMVVVDGQGIPLESHIDSASPAEVTLAEDLGASQGPRWTAKPSQDAASATHYRQELRLVILSGRGQETGITLFSP